MCQFPTTTWTFPRYVLIAYLNSGLARPSYQYLLPGKRYRDDYTYMEGNPLLKPTKYYIIGLENAFLRLFNLSLDLTFNTNQISSIRKDEGGGVQQITFMNATDSRVFRAAVSVPFDLLKEKLNGNINFSTRMGKYTKTRNSFVLPENSLIRK